MPEKLPFNSSKRRWLAANRASECSCGRIGVFPVWKSTKQISVGLNGILQVMEPICEAKFSENSNGFRPNRSAETAIAQCCRLIQVQHLYHVVDLDIKGFFDNINHTKLIRQIWSLGIRDKKLLCIIKQMLKAPVILPNGEKIYPTKGTPQGGILSPLLANIVLNELDWWIASQWENMPTRTEFTIRQNRAGAEIKSHVYRALRRSNLKEMHSVRYGSRSRASRSGA